MAPPQSKPAKKKKGSTKVALADADDYLHLGDTYEEAMRKHRVGNPAKASRFADRARETYTEGLIRFPLCFDLAYNKARIELEKGTDPVLSQRLDVPAISMLRDSLSTHSYAQSLEPEHADTLFNMAQTLMAIAEIMAGDDDSDDLKVLLFIQEALEMQSRCFELQSATFAESRLELEQAMSEASQQGVPQADGREMSPDGTTAQPQDFDHEEQWVSIEEPVTADTLLDTIIAQFQALSTLYSILNCPLASSAESASNIRPIVSWADSYSLSIVSEILPDLISENHTELGPRLPDLMLSRAIFMSNYLERSFRSSKIGVQEYEEELDAAFSEDELDETSEEVLQASAGALLCFERAVAHTTSLDAADATSHAALRWRILIEAQTRLSSVARIPDIDRHTVATTHSLRGDISLLLQMLAYSPVGYVSARSMTPQLLKHAEIYYRNASKLLGSLGRSTDDEERAICELKGAVVGVMQYATTNLVVDGSTGWSQSRSGGTHVGLMTTAAKVELALGPMVRIKGKKWVRDQIEEMDDEGLVLSHVFVSV